MNSEESPALAVAMPLLTMVPGQAAGTETYVRGLATELGRTTSGVDLNLVGRPRLLDGANLGRARWDRVSVPARKGGGPSVRWLALTAQRTRIPSVESCDVVHYPATVPLPGTDRPHIITLHDVQHLDAPEWISPLRRTWRRFYYDGAARRANAVITVSNHAKARIVERLEVPDDRVFVIHHGLADPPEDQVSRALPASAGSQPFVLYPAGLWPHKNHESLLGAFQLASLRDPDLHLILTGATFGGERKLREQAERLRIGPKVRHLGYVSTSELYALFRHAQSVVFPSMYEGFGYPPLEAMSVGCPVAVSDMTALPEMCGDAAIYFDPHAPEQIADAILRLGSDSALRESLVQRGYAQAGKFTWSECASEHSRVYRSVAAASS